MCLLCMHTYVCVHKLIVICVCVYMCMCVCACAHVCMCVCGGVCVYKTLVFMEDFLLVTHICVYAASQVSMRLRKRNKNRSAACGS